MCARARVHACHALVTGDEALAKLTSKLSLVVIACVQTFTGLCLIALRHQVHANALRLPSSSSRIILKWGYIFSESAAVVQEVAAVLPLCGCYAVLDAICGVSAGKGSACASPSFIFLTRFTFLYLPHNCCRHPARLRQTDGWCCHQHTCVLGYRHTYINSVGHTEGVS